MHCLYILLVLIFSTMVNSKEFLQIPETEIIIKPLPQPYKKEIVSKDELINFLKTSSNQPIVIFGANWCPDCQILSAVLSLPTVKKFMDQHFSIILIDLGRYDINMNLLELVGISQKDGVPRVVIFDKNRKATNLETNDIWRTARDRSPQEIFDYFQLYNEDGGS